MPRRAVPDRALPRIAIPYPAPPRLAVPNHDAHKWAKWNGGNCTRRAAWLLHSLPSHTRACRAVPRLTKPHLATPYHDAPMGQSEVWALHPQAAWLLYPVLFAVALNE